MFPLQSSPRLRPARRSPQQLPQGHPAKSKFLAIDRSAPWQCGHERADMDGQDRQDFWPDGEALLRPILSILTIHVPSSRDCPVSDTNGTEFSADPLFLSVSERVDNSSHEDTKARRTGLCALVSPCENFLNSSQAWHPKHPLTPCLRAIRV